MTVRAIVQVLPSQPAEDGAGVKIQRQALFNNRDTDPILMIDEIRSSNPDDYIAGFPPHPHRGIETLTYLKQGGLVHEDHLGHRREIHSGGAQWMSTGRGIIHSEMPVLEQGGLHGFQIWINLAAAHKMKTPEYRDVEAHEIPQLTLPDNSGTVRVLAGSWSLAGQEVAGPLDRLSASTRLLDIQLAPGGHFATSLASDDQVMAYVYEGRLAHERAIERGHLVIFGAGRQVHLTSATGAGVLLLAGRPLREPVAHYGPFVMNTPEQIEQALRDYRDGAFLR